MIRTRVKHWLLITADVLIAVYIVLAVSAFNKPDEMASVCNKVNIEVADESTNGFITKGEILQRLESTHLYPMGKPMRYIDTRKIEEKLMTQPFVKTAECYKTQGGSVNIKITQLLPVIRVKASNGDDYYLDDKDCIMPNSHYTSDLIIASGHISRQYAKTYVSPLARIIMDNELWRNSIEQINVLSDKGIELVPRVGNHIIHLGRLPSCDDKEERFELINEFMNRKMTRLEKFYKYGLSVVGWNVYAYIDLEFDNQIICRRNLQKDY